MKDFTHRSTSIAACAALALALLGSACSDQPGVGQTAAKPESDTWTMLGHDLSSTYNNRAEKVLRADNVAGLKLAWQLDLAGSVTSAAAQRDGTAYVQSSGGLYALNASDGTIVWQNPDVKGTSSATLGDGVVYANDTRSVLHAVDATTGAEIWHATIDPNRFASGFGSPILFETLVIVGSASSEEAGVSENATFRGGMVAFDRQTGAEVWRYYTADPPYNGAAMWATPTIDPATRTVYGATGNNYTEQAGPTSDSIFALDVDTGALRWNKQLTQGDIFTILNPQSPDTDFGTNPILIDVEIDGRTRHLLGAGQKSGVFWVLDRESGDVVWSRAISPGSALIGGMLNNGAYDGAHFIVAGNHGTSTAPGSEPSTGAFGADSTSVLMALDPKDGSTVWERQLGSWVWAPITIANGIGFVGVDKELQAFDVATGAILFRYAVEGTIASAPTIANGMVVVGSGLSYLVGTPSRKLYALSLTGTGGGGGGGGATFDPIFSAIYNEIIVGKGCNTGSCHGSDQGNLLMSSQSEAYANLVGVKASGPLCGASGLTRVVPGDPASSLMFDKVSSATPVCGSTMPPGAPLSAQEVEQIRSWIERGAAND
jgi:polyvinyl alcohol dehydrogenase (cytochrome)